LMHVTSNMEASYLKKHLGENIVLINIPILMEMGSEPETIRTEPFLLYVGRFHTKKGIDLLLKALVKSRSFLESPYILKIGGDYKNSYGTEILELIEQLHLTDKVQLLGVVAGKEKDDLYRKAYFTVMPSITENFGMVAAESLSFGTPVITTTGTPWNIVETTHSGFYVDCNYFSISEAIDAAIDMPEKEYLRFRQNARKIVAHFNVATKIHDWIEKYESLSGSPARTGK
jgi:glycosyltransferase involved in cell wall biosynthesis